MPVDDETPPPSTPTAATCDRCGAVVHFEPPDSAVVVMSTAGTVTTLCPSCSADLDKERKWRETGGWVGSDLPPSPEKKRRGRERGVGGGPPPPPPPGGPPPATPEELRLLFGTPPTEGPATEDGPEDEATE